MKKNKNHKWIIKNYVETPSEYPFTQWLVYGAEIYGYKKMIPWWNSLMRKRKSGR